MFMQFKPLTEHNRLVQKIPAPSNQMASISYMFNSHIYIYFGELMADLGNLQTHATLEALGEYLRLVVDAFRDLMIVH